MLLTAQRVRSAAGEEGVNAFCNLHGSFIWEGEPPAGIPESNPGEPANQSIAVPPGGNLVRSYLDVVAPDETSTWEILGAVQQFIVVMRGRHLPWNGTIGRCTIRFGIDLGLEPAWVEEFRRLLVAAMQVRVAA
jgi:hypothetical protein